MDVSSVWTQADTSTSLDNVALLGAAGWNDELDLARRPDTAQRYALTIPKGDGSYPPIDRSCDGFR
uniref:Uncharacterized protein n=1 Tax=Mycobacterium riyadhense TaxID=486698 RepID=A0A653F2C6_9MYCO|nr:hypothetical protein BIN_B_05317 [Mycobacterium riyadhense]